MQPSSLVFLALIAIWAAYLLQHWVRRREHLATARSVDRFSDAMRVLERRGAPPDLEPSSLPSLPPRSYAHSLTRPSRPEVVVKRAQPSVPNDPPLPTTAVRPTRIFHLLAGVSARRLRGLSLLVSLSLVLVVLSLSVFSVLPWWSFPVAVAILAADVAWLRHVAMSERDGRARMWATGSAEEESAFDFEFAPEPEPEPEVAPTEAVEVVEPPQIVEPTQIIELPQTLEPPQTIEIPVDADPFGWEPVPVPPPTYTLKAMAVPPVPVPAAVIEPSSESEPLSLEGLVYDYDLDELVERRSATGT